MALRCFTLKLGQMVPGIRIPPEKSEFSLLSYYLWKDTRFSLSASPDLRDQPLIYAKMQGVSGNNLEVVAVEGTPHTTGALVYGPTGVDLLTHNQLCPRIGTLLFAREGVYICPLCDGAFEVAGPDEYWPAKQRLRYVHPSGRSTPYGIRAQREVDFAEVARPGDRVSRYRSPNFFRFTGDDFTKHEHHEQLQLPPVIGAHRLINNYWEIPVTDYPKW